MLLEGVNRGDQLPSSGDRVAADHRGAGPGRERMGRRPRHPLAIELASVAFGGAEHCPRVVGDGRRRHRASAAGMEDIDAHELDAQQERCLQRRPRFAKSAPAGRAVPGIEVDVKMCAELVQMLKVEPVPRPVLDGLIGPGAGLTDIVVRQPGQRLDSSAGGRRQVAVAALAGLLVQKLESAAELALPSHAEKRPEPEDMRRVELPYDPGTLLAEDGRGAVEQLKGGGKAAPEELDASGREGCHADGMGVTDLLRQPIGGLDQPCRAARGGPALGGRVDCFPRHGQGNPQRLSSPESSDQGLRLPGGPLDHVHEADPERERARDVDPKQFLRRNFAGVASLKPEASQ